MEPLCFGHFYLANRSSLRSARREERRTMKYEYITVTGKTEIEVNDHFGELLVSMDREEYNSNRKHSRRRPVSLENTEYEGEWFEAKYDAIGESETAIDMERVMASLSELQRICFVETRINGKSQREVAAGLGKSRSTVQHAVDGAITILNNFFT